jgi:hypothetical protein
MGKALRTVAIRSSRSRNYGMTVSNDMPQLTSIVVESRLSRVESNSVPRSAPKPVPNSQHGTAAAHRQRHEGSRVIPVRKWELP